jgi:hypothetical protein
MANIMIDALLREWRGNGDRAQKLLANIPQDRALDQPHGLVNHPVWTIGHLTTYQPGIVSLARGEAVDDPAQKPEAKLFANGTKPLTGPAADAAAYPALAELAKLFAQNHATVDQAVSAMDPAVLEQDPGLERWKNGMDKTGLVLVHLMVMHEAHHLCELAMWKKAAGIPLFG